MEIKQALLIIFRHLAAAIGFLTLGYVFLEWVMPGSVLPLVDVIDLLPFAAIIFFLALLPVKRKKNAWNYVQIFLGIVMSILLLSLFWIKIDGYSLKNSALIGAGTICLIVWTASMIRSKPATPGRN